MHRQTAPAPTPLSPPPRRARRDRAALIKEVRERVKARGYDLAAIAADLLADGPAGRRPA